MQVNHLLQGLIDHHKYLVEQSANVSTYDELKSLKGSFQTYKFTCKHHLVEGNVKKYQVTPMISAMRDILFNIECRIDNIWFGRD